MSNTGATTEQIEAAAELITAGLYGMKAEWGELSEDAQNDAERYFRNATREVERVAMCLVDSTHAIVPVALLDALAEMFAKSYANSPTGDIMIVPDDLFANAEEAFDAVMKDRGE